MKKILSTLLLLTFCTVQSTWAGEVIIIGSDGQARYEDENKNIPVSQKVIESTKQKNILNEVTITDETGKRESIYIDYRGNVKKIENEQISQTEQINVDKTKEAEYQKIVKNAPQTLNNVDSILSKYGYSKKDNSSKSKQEYMKMNLLDGDYVIAYKDTPYIAEYHKDGSLMGLAKIEKKELSETKGSVVFYEYRVGYNTTSGMGLKHIMFMDFEKDKHISQYIYNVNGKLLCRQINNDIYVASEARNMIPDWSKKKDVNTINQSTQALYKQQEKQSKMIDNKIANGVAVGILAAPHVLAAPFILAGVLGIGAILIATLPITIPIGFWDFDIL